jgi:hypothetical protein
MSLYRILDNAIQLRVQGVGMMDFEIVGSSADHMPKRPLWRRVKDMNPVWFVKASLSFMQGTPKREIWAKMLPTYIRYCRSCLEK